jgi:hypothetical protein
MKIEALTQEDHGHLKWSAPIGFVFAKSRQLIQLSASDLVIAQACFPLAFISEGGQFRMAAVCSFFPDQNLYVKLDGSWAAHYVPAAIRAHPFYWVTDALGRPALGFDASSGLIGEEGQPLFDDNNQPSPDLEEVIKHLAETAQGTALLQKAVDALREAKLISPWNIQLQDGEVTRRLEGLYCIDEAALAALPIAELDHIRSLGALPVAYAQLFSMQHLKTLAHLAQTERPQPIMRMPQEALEKFTAEKDVLDFSMLRD